MDERPNFKFGTDSEVLFIYRLIPRKSDFLRWLAIFDTTPISRFLGASRGIHGRIQHQMLVSGYQSIDMLCIVLFVKFDGGLSMLIWRNKQLFYKP
jgi:hypothetical protein